MTDDELTEEIIGAAIEVHRVVIRVQLVINRRAELRVSAAPR